MYPLPRMDDILSKLGGSSVFSQIHLKYGYWQLFLDRKSQSKTAFVTPDGLYECTRLPLGLHNCGASFQRLVDLALGNLIWTAFMVYLDDLVAMGKNFKEYHPRLTALLTALEKASLQTMKKVCSSQMKSFVWATEFPETEPNQIRIKFKQLWSFPLRTVTRQSSVRRPYAVLLVWRRIIETSSSDSRKRRRLFMRC